MTFMDIVNAAYGTNEHSKRYLEKFETIKKIGYNFPNTLLEFLPFSMVTMAKFMRTHLKN